MTKTLSTFLLGALLATAACSTGGTPDSAGVRQTGRYSVTYEGPEVEATVLFHGVDRDMGGGWLVVVAQLRGTARGGITTIHRDNISLRTPDGRRRPLLTQSEFRQAFREINTRVRRLMSSSEPLQTYASNIRRCDRWFLTQPTEGFSLDELAVSPFEVCWGPLVFEVPGGVQPGRWRLIIDLEESRVDIPFELEVDG